MPNDLFGGNPNFSASDVQQESQPRDLFGGNPHFGAQPIPQNNVGQQAPTSNSSIDENDGMHLNSLGRHLLANAGSAAQNTLQGMNLPRPEQYFKGIPTFQGRNENFYNDLGVKKGILDSLSEGAMEYAPFGGGAAKAMKLGSQVFPKFAKFMQKDPKYLASAMENALAGGAYGAAQDGTSGAKTGAVLGALSPFPSAATNAALKYGAEKIAQSAIPGLTKRATGYMRNLLDPNDYSKMLYNRFSSMFDRNKSAWGDVNSAATNIDKNLTGKSQTSPSFVKSPGQSFQYQEVEGLPTIIGKDYSGQPSGRQFSGSDPYTGAPIFKQPDEYSAPVLVNQPKGAQVSSLNPSSIVATGYQDAGGAPIMQDKINFNASPYHDYIDNFMNKVQGMEPAKRQQYAQAINLATKARELAPQSFSGAVASRQNINQDMKDFLNQQGSNNANNAMNSQSRQFLAGLKNTLKTDIPQSNMENVGESAMNDFTDKWSSANKAHQDLQEFYKSPQPGSGVVKPVRQTREAFQAAQQGQQLDPAIIAKYMPRPNQGGTQGLEQLSTVMGSKSAAQDAAKSYINKRPLTNGVSTLDVSNEYAKLSPAQRDWIYGDSQEGKLLKATNDTRQAFGKEPARSLLQAGAHHVMGYGLPGLAGYLASDYAGGNWKENILSGLGAAAAAHGAGKMAGKLSPETIQNLIRYAQRSPSNYGRYFNMPLQTAASGIYGGNNQ